MSKAGKHIKTLNKAMESANKRAIRVNKALGLDTVYVEGESVIREHSDGRKSIIENIKPTKTTNGVPAVKKTLKIG